MLLTVPYAMKERNLQRHEREEFATRKGPSSMTATTTLKRTHPTTTINDPKNKAAPLSKYKSLSPSSSYTGSESTNAIEVQLSPVITAEHTEDRAW